MADDSVSLSGSEALLNMEVLSPNTHSRFHEKEQLQELNGRLAVFMDRIQCVRDQNDDLRAELERTKDTHKREMDTQRSLFERELSEARKLLDETAKEKARFELAASRNSTQATDAKQKLEDEMNCRNRLDKLLNESERELQKSRHHVDELVKEQRKLEDRITQSVASAESYQEQAETARTELESEMVARVNAQNNCQSLHEEIAFTLSVHAQEKEDVLSRLAGVEREYNALKTLFEKELELRVAQTLAIARDEQEKESDRIRADIEHLYSCKIKDASDRHDRDLATLNKLSSENTVLSDKNHLLSEENAKLTAKIAQLSKQLDNREYERLRDREHYRVETERLQKELEVLQHELSSKLTEFADLMDVNIRLDKEISRYHRLLHEQEKKVGLDGGLLPSTPLSARRSSRVQVSHAVSCPPPPPLSTLPRRSTDANMSGIVPPPLPPRGHSSSEDENDDGGVAAGASSFMSFLFTGISRKRRRPAMNCDTDSVDMATAYTDQPSSSVDEAMPAAATSTSESTDGPISLEVCSQGQFVKLHSNAHSDIALSGWRLELQAENKAMTYRFPRSALLTPGSTVTVWCGGAGHTAHPPTDFISRHVTNWREHSHSPLVLLDDMSDAQATYPSPSPATPICLDHNDASTSASPMKKRYNKAPMSPSQLTLTAVSQTDPQAASCTDTDGDEGVRAAPADQQDSGIVDDNAQDGPVRRSRSAVKNVKGKAARLRARSKSPGRRNLAKSLATVASTTDSHQIGTDSETSEEVGEKERRRPSIASSVLSAAFSNRRRIQASSSASNVGHALTSAESRSSVLAESEARISACDSNEEIFHVQGDPGKEGCVIC